MRKIKGLAIESIEFQTDTFGSDIEACLYKLKKLVDADHKLKTNSIFLDNFGDEFNKLVFDRLGVNIKLIVNTRVTGSVIVFPINQNNVLVEREYRNNYYRVDYERALKSFRNSSGTVDLHMAKLSGIFSTYEHKLYCDVIGNLDFGLTVPEVAAIILHELGHVFTYYELSNRLNSTNQILANLSQTIKGTDTSEKRTYLFKELTTVLNIDPNGFSDLVGETNRAIFSTTLAKRYSLAVNSLLGNMHYDETSAEQSADNFAARFGYGKHLITSFEKLHRNGPEKHRGIYFFVALCDLLSIAVGGVVMLFSLVAGVTAPLLLIIPVVMISNILFSDKNNNTEYGKDAVTMSYDNLKDRYTRIRNQMVEQVNDIKLDKDDLKKLIANVHNIDQIIKDTKIYTPILARIMNFIQTENRSHLESKNLQLMLEQLAHNDLFLKSAELRAI